MSKIPSIQKDIVWPQRPIDINVILNTSSKNKMQAKNALLYQDILKYAREQEYKNDGNGFRFTDLANWLMRNNLEFLEYYSDSDKHTPPNVKIANNRQRIEGLLDGLIRLGLLKVKTIIQAEKNKEPTELYDFTVEGHLLSWLIKARDDEERLNTEIKSEIIQYRAVIKPEDKELRNKTRSNTIQPIQDIIDKCAEISDSYTILFVNRFFKKCMKKGSFSSIVSFFMSSILPWYSISTGRDLLLLFLGARSILNWMIADRESFFEVLMGLDEEAKTIILFQFKMEIEQYHKENYLKDDLKAREFNEKLAIQAKKEELKAKQLGLSRETGDNNEPYNDLYNIVRIPGKEWQITQFYNIGDYSKVSIPGYCDICKEHRSFLVDIFIYLNCIQSSHTPPSGYSVVSGECTKCSQGMVSAQIMRLDHFVSAWR